MRLLLRERYVSDARPSPKVSAGIFLIPRALRDKAVQVSPQPPSLVSSPAADTWKEQEPQVTGTCPSSASALTTSHSSNSQSELLPPIPTSVASLSSQKRTHIDEKKIESNRCTSYSDVLLNQERYEPHNKKPITKANLQNRNGGSAEKTEAKLVVRSDDRSEAGSEVR
eukprot:764998-Hanusia_phi.AAC.1